MGVILLEFTLGEVSMATVVSCVNLKGGVGKTTLAVNMAAYFGRLGKRTLLIKVDPSVKTINQRV